MFILVNEYDFINAFENSSRKDSFSRQALSTLFNYFEDDDIELDIIAICYEFSEFESIEEVCNEFDIFNECDLSDSMIHDDVRNWLERRTMVLFFF